MRQQRGEGWKWHWGIITCYRGCVTPWAAQAPQTWLCFPALLSWWLGAAAELHKLHLVLQSLPCFHQISSVMGLHFCLWEASLISNRKQSLGLFRDKSLKIHSWFKQFYYDFFVCVCVCLCFCFVYGFCHANCMSFCFGLAVTMPLQFLRIARKRGGMEEGAGTTKQCSEIWDDENR